MAIKESELILNKDGSIYQLKLKPDNVAKDIIFVGDQDRVNMVTKLFDSIEFTTQKREFKTTTGSYKGKRITVISTGIGPDNIDIVLNELDAVVNINLKTRELKKELTTLNIIRIGTSGSLQKNIPVDSFLMSSYAIDLNGMLHSYQIDDVSNLEIENAFTKQTNWSDKKSAPIVISNSTYLEKKLISEKIHKGMTATAGGFYAPQGRVLRLGLQDSEINSKINKFNYKGIKVSNLEMETSAIYGLCKLLGHNACSMNAIIANRTDGTFSKNYQKVVNDLILYTLNRLVD